MAMEDFIQDLKKNLSVDNIVILMKDANVIDNKTLTEEEVRNTLGTIDTSKNVDEIAMKLKELGDVASKRVQEAQNIEQKASLKDAGNKVTASANIEDYGAASINVLQKPSANKVTEEPKEKKASEIMYEFI